MSDVSDRPPDPFVFTNTIMFFGLAKLGPFTRYPSFTANFFRLQLNRATKARALANREPNPFVGKIHHLLPLLAVVGNATPHGSHQPRGR